MTPVFKDINNILRDSPALIIPTYVTNWELVPEHTRTFVHADAVLDSAGKEWFQQYAHMYTALFCYASNLNDHTGASWS